MTKKIILFSLLISLSSASLQCMEEDPRFKNVTFFRGGRDTRRERNKQKLSLQPTTPRSTENQSQATTTTTVSSNVTTTRGNRSRRTETLTDEKVREYQTRLYNMSPSEREQAVDMAIKMRNYPAAVSMVPLLSPDSTQAMILQEATTNLDSAKEMISFFKPPHQTNWRNAARHANSSALPVRATEIYEKLQQDLQKQRDLEKQNEPIFVKLLFHQKMATGDYAGAYKLCPQLHGCYEARVLETAHFDTEKAKKMIDTNMPYHTDLKNAVMHIHKQNTE